LSTQPGSNTSLLRSLVPPTLVALSCGLLPTLVALRCCCCCRWSVCDSHLRCLHPLPSPITAPSFVTASLQTAPSAPRPPTTLGLVMYITPDLFGGTSAHDRGDTTDTTRWSAMADSAHAAGLGKRKRHEAEEGTNTYGSRPVALLDSEADFDRSSCLHHQRLSPASRSLTRFQSHNMATFDTTRNLSYSMYSSPPLYTTSDRRPQKQMKRVSPKATLVKSTSHLMDLETDLSASSPKAVSHTHTANDLRPCHACKSAPKRRKDLENYLDCRRCEGRTCYICARQCFGACGKAVCKKCIVEVGEEGDPWCLDCYALKINS
jgi:hypothetical protein